MSPLTTASRWALVPDARPRPIEAVAAADAPIRRYRLARLAVNPHRDGRDPHTHLKRTYD